MTTAPLDHVLRLRTPQDVLAAVPYLMGHHPTDSLVAVGVRGAHLHFHVRVDLPSLDAPDDDVGALAEHFAGVLAPHGCDGVLLIGYGSAAQVARFTEALQVPFITHQIQVYDVFRATRDRFWSMLCQDEGCCPDEGRPYDVASSPVAAAATVAGYVALADREAIVATLAAPTGARLTAIKAATVRACDRLGECVATAKHPTAELLRSAGAALTGARAHYASGGRLTDDEVGWLTALLVTPAAVDLAWRRMSRTSRSAWRVWEHMWADILARCDPSYAAAPGVLLAYAMWRTGDGLRANVAVDRALTTDPDYPAAKALAEILRRALSPALLDRFGPRPSRMAPGRRLARAHARRRRKR